MKYFFLSWIFILLPFTAWASEWQWSVELTGFVSDETNAHPRAFLWIPPSCEQVKAVVIGQHNMSEEGILEHPAFRKAMEELGIAEIWITPGIDQVWDITTGTQTIFEEMMEQLGELSGYPELKDAPVVPIGHSAMATYPWNFAITNPERTLAILSVHGDSPKTHLTGYGRKNLDWGDRTIEGIPGLIVMGEYEWWEDRLFTAFDYRREYPDAPLSLLADAGRGHFDHSDGLVNYLALFIKKAIQYRLPKTMSVNKPIKLVPVCAKNGWLADRWRKDEVPHAKAAPYDDYEGDRDSAFWYFDKEMAEVTEEYYAKVRGKKEQYIGFVQNGRLLTYDPKSHVRIQASFQPESDGVTFYIGAAYTDSMRTRLSNDHAKGKINISRICGPVEQINDTTFIIRFYRMGLNNKKRTGDIWLLAMNDGDKEYKSSVQQFSLRIPYRIEDGNMQHITFPALSDVKAGAQYLPLNAISNSALPVYYYVLEGPARIEGNKVVFTCIPPKATYPVKVTVVGWQYGIKGKWNTAETVTQSFYIRN